MNKKTESYFSIKGLYQASKDHKSYFTRNMRIGIIVGLLMYALFGILDYYAMPENYKTAWIIRFVIVSPAAILLLFITYTKLYDLAPSLWKVLLVIIGQLGIVGMIVLAEPQEIAFWTYYAGLILVILWGGFILRLTTPEMIIISVTNVVFYNIASIFIQDMLSFPAGSEEFTHFLNNNFFFIFSSICAVIGTSQLNSFWKRLVNQNKVLEDEKKNLIEAKKKAEESDMLKSAFLANMSHEIRTPMNAVIGFSDLLKRGNVSKQKEEKFLSIIHSKSKQLMHLIDDIIDVSKIEANQLHIDLHPVNLDKLMEELSLVFKEIVKKNEKGDRLTIELKAIGNSPSKQIMLDETRFSQVLSNLVTNAIKFTNKGKIEIGYQIYKQEFLLFYVKDSGIGISHEKQKIIFERFRQSDESIAPLYGGTGLGLSITKGLVELMGGNIWLESQIGQGSSFSFTVPYKVSESDEDKKTEINIDGTPDWTGKKYYLLKMNPKMQN